MFSPEICYEICHEIIYDHLSVKETLHLLALSRS